SQDNFFIAQNEPMLSAKKAARRLGIAQDYVGRLCREGKLEGRLISGAWFVIEASILAFEVVRTQARAARSEELSQLRKKENKFFKNAQGVPDVAAKNAVSTISRIASYPYTKSI